MLIILDQSSSASIYEQIVMQTKKALSTGDLAAGDKLPPARQLAESLDVNMHTVLKAYKILAEQDLVSIRRGRGVTVRSSQSLDRVKILAEQLAVEAKIASLDASQTIQLVKEYL